MHVVVRRYAEASVLLDEMARQPEEVEELLAGVPGFIAYYAVRTARGLMTVTVCEDARGTDESTRRAAAWVRENVRGGPISAPEITAGEAFLSFGR